MKTLQDLGACPEAVAWAANYSTLAEAWANCERGDWMAWLCERLCVPISAEYYRADAAAWAEYRRAAESAWAEYERARAPARAEYERATAAALRGHWPEVEAAIAGNPVRS
jgi:hypothetical protein